MRGARLWTDFDWAGGTTSLGGDYAFNHIYSTNLGEKLSVPHGHYTHAKARHTGNVWLRHAKQWRRFDAAASARRQPDALRHFGVVERFGRLATRCGTASGSRGVAVDASAYLHRSLLLLAGADQQPRPDSGKGCDIPH